MLRRFRPALAVLSVLATLPLAAPAVVQAQALGKPDRADAEQALETVEQLTDGRAHGDKRELTPALAQLVRTKASLDAADRRRANRILARPPDGGQQIGKWSAPAGDQRAFCSPHFCVRWVTTTGDAPVPGDTDADNVPDYVEFVSAAFEQSYATEVGALHWTAPLDDNKPTAAEDQVDVYISDIGDDAYGFAVPEGSARSVPSYLVVDNDYSDAQFPRYDNAYEVPVEATAAHEFNHVLQFVYDTQQDLWLMESTATWAEDKVFDDANDYRFYLPSWAQRPDEPLTSPDGLKMYGSAIFAHWLDQRRPDVIRRTWAQSQANSVSGLGYAPGALDHAIRDLNGPGFASEFSEFTSATAEWDATNSGIREGATFPDEVARSGQLEPDGAPAIGTVDHTAFAFYDVAPPSGAANLNLTGGLPAGTTGAIALVGLSGTTQTRAVKALDADGSVTVSLADPGQYTRITAVVVNADTSNGGFDGTDWIWTKDARAYTLTAATGEPPVEPSPTPTPTPTASATPSATATPTPTPVARPDATSVRLSRSSTKLPSVLRMGVLSVFAQANKAGRYSAKATVDAKTAKRLKVGRRTTSAGTGRRTATAPARLKVNIKLTRKLRAALKRNRKRAVKIKVAVTFLASDGTGAVRKTITIKLKP